MRHRCGCAIPDPDGPTRPGRRCFQRLGATSPREDDGPRWLRNMPPGRSPPSVRSTPLSSSSLSARCWRRSARHWGRRGGTPVAKRTPHYSTKDPVCAHQTEIFNICGLPTTRRTKNNVRASLRSRFETIPSRESMRHVLFCAAARTRMAFFAALRSGLIFVPHRCTADISACEKATGLFPELPLLRERQPIVERPLVRGEKILLAPRPPTVAPKCIAQRRHVCVACGVPVLRGRRSRPGAPPLARLHGTMLRRAHLA